MEYVENVTPYERGEYRKEFVLSEKQKEALEYKTKRDFIKYDKLSYSEKKNTKKFPDYFKDKNNEEEAFTAALDQKVPINGWMNVRNGEGKVINKDGTVIDKNLEGKRTEHIVILTIPDKPENDKIGEALGDYTAAGKIVPFTCCPCC